jgi:hypothetical protein
MPPLNAKGLHMSLQIHQQSTFGIYVGEPLSLKQLFFKKPMPYAQAPISGAGAGEDNVGHATRAKA